MTTLPHRIASDRERADRIARYKTNWQYYEGDHRIASSTRRHRRPRNIAETMIDTIVDHMGDPGVIWGQDDHADVFDEHHAHVMAANATELTDHTTELSATVAGDGCWKVTYDDDERRIKIANVDPAGLWVLTAPDDPADIQQIAHQYTVGLDHLPLLFPGIVIPSSRKTVRITEAWTKATWEIWAEDDQVQIEPNPYDGAIPYILFPNIRRPGKTWGVGDMARIIDFQDRYNESGADLDDMMELAHAVVLLSGVDNGADLQVRPGAVWDMPPDAKAELLDFLRGNAARQRLDYHSALRTELQQAARVPDLALGLEKSTQLSGAALTIMLGPLLRLVARKRLTRADAHRRRARLIARLGALFEGLPDAGDRVPEVYWTEALPSDRAEELANAQAEYDLGASRETILGKIGYDDAADEIAKRRQEDKQDGPDSEREPGTDRQRPSVSSDR